MCQSSIEPDPTYQRRERARVQEISVTRFGRSAKGLPRHRSALAMALALWRIMAT